MAVIEIALCITDLEFGGAEKALVELATRLDRRRFEPVVYCLGPSPPLDEQSCLPQLKAAGIEVYCLGARGSWQALPVLSRLQGLLAERRPALVQTFLFHANLAGRIAARRAGIGQVACGIRVAEPRRRHLWADRLTSRLVDRYVCVSESVARFCEFRARLPVEKLVVIPNGIDTAKYPARSAADLRSLGVRPGRRLVTYVGRLEPQKGLRWLIHSAADWLDRLPEWDLLVVGKGRQQAALERLCRRRGIAGRVWFVGWRSNVPEILAASELLVLPSRWEGMPNVVLEAMASRLPVVVSDLAGVSEVLGLDAEPQTVRYGDSEALAERLCRLVSDGDLRAELGHRNRQRVEEGFTIERVVGAYEGLWESLVEG